MGLTSIGTMTFSTQYILTETFSSEIIRSISFGLFYSESAESTDLIIRTTVNLPGFDKHLSAIVPLRSTDVTIKEEKLALVDGDLFAIIPSGGRGTVEVVFTDWSQKKYSITPGLIFAVKVAGSSVIEHLSRGYFTTERTVLSFPARSVIYVMKVAADGALVPDVEIVTESSFIVNVAIQSLVGIVRVSNTGSMTTFGEARFQIMPIAFSNSSSPVAYIGVFNLIARGAINITEVQLPLSQLKTQKFELPKLTTNIQKTVTAQETLPIFQVKTQKVELPKLVTNIQKTVTVQEQLPVVELKTQKIELPKLITNIQKTVTAQETLPIFQLKTQKVDLPKLVTNTQKTVTVQQQLPIFQVKTQTMELPSRQVTYKVESEPKITTRTFVTTTKNVSGKLL